MNPTQKVYTPQSLPDLNSILADNNTGEITYIAGATDLMVAKKDWHNTDTLIDLNHIKEITQNIDFEDNGIRIGAAVPMSDLIAHKAINKEFPMLVEACRQIGSVQIQNRATVGGNIANASPAGDTLPVLAVYKAIILRALHHTVLLHPVIYQ